MSEGTYLGRPVDDWVGALTSDDPLQRRLGAYALGEIGPAATSAVPALRDALDDDVSFVRTWVAAALLRVDPDQPAAIGVLAASLDDDRDFVRSLAAWLLGRLGPRTPGIDATLEPLRARLQDADASVRTEAGVALDRLQRASTRGRATS